MTMSRSERTALTHLDRTLEERQKTMARADRDALAKLQRAGFQFKTIAEAIDYQNRAREAARLEANLVSMRHELRERKTA